DDNSYYEEVPNTWQLLKLKNLLQLDNGTKQQNERLIYWDAKTLRGIKDAEFKEKGNKVHSKDTVILVDGENSGELFMIPNDGYMGSTFKKIHYLEVGSKKYIDLYIDSKKELLKNSKTGSAIPHLNKTLFKELIVALPPIQEQKRISSKITQIFSQINQLI
ncbi:restriction endonuclease subunit S, partial [Streptococcus sp. 2154]